MEAAVIYPGPKKTPKLLRSLPSWEGNILTRVRHFQPRGGSLINDGRKGGCKDLQIPTQLYKTGPE